MMEGCGSWIEISMVSVAASPMTVIVTGMIVAGMIVTVMTVIMLLVTMTGVIVT
jgi:uncharacterized membrane protein YedE/YeeE